MRTFLREIGTGAFPAGSSTDSCALRNIPIDKRLWIADEDKQARARSGKMT